MFNQCNIFLFTRKRRTPATTTVAVSNFYTIGSHFQRHKKWYDWKWNLQIRIQVPVNIGCGWTRVQMKRRPTIITVHLPAPAASPSASGPRSRLKTIFTCIQTNNRNSTTEQNWKESERMKHLQLKSKQSHGIWVELVNRANVVIYKDCCDLKWIRV